MNSLQYVNDNRIVELTINENRIIEGAFLKDNAPVKFKTIIPYQDNALVQKLVEKNVKMKGKMPEEGLFYKFRESASMAFNACSFFSFSSCASSSLLEARR